MDWRKDREVRLAVEKVTTMLKSINTQAQRGNFAVVQLYVQRNGDDKTNFFQEELIKKLKRLLQILQVKN